MGRGAYNEYYKAAIVIPFFTACVIANEREAMLTDVLIQGLAHMRFITTSIYEQNSI